MKQRQPCFMSEIENKSPRIFVSDITVNYGKEALIYSVQGVSSQFQFIENCRNE